MAGPDLSRLRQTLRDLYCPDPNELGVFLSDKPLLRGTLYTQRRRCGKKSCRCVTGALHESLVLTVTMGGKTRLWRPATDRVEEMRDWIQSYRHLRRARARLIKEHARRLREMLRLIDAIARRRMQTP